MFLILDQDWINFIWRPLAAWAGRSDLERAEKKRKAVRQDISRWASRMRLPYKPPPLTTDPTIAAAGSLLAERKGLLKPYVERVMHAEWGEGQDISKQETLLNLVEEIGLDRKELAQTINSEDSLKILGDSWQEAENKGVFGVPSFVVDEEIFWGNDRIGFLEEYLVKSKDINLINTSSI